MLKLGNVILSPPLPTKAFYSQFKNRRNSIKVAHFVSQLFRKLIGFIDTSMQQWALHEFKMRLFASSCARDGLNNSFAESQTT